MHVKFREDWLNVVVLRHMKRQTETQQLITLSVCYGIAMEQIIKRK